MLSVGTFFLKHEHIRGGGGSGPLLPRDVRYTNFTSYKTSLNVTTRLKPVLWHLEGCKQNKKGSRFLADYEFRFIFDKPLFLKLSIVT